VRCSDWPYTWFRLGWRGQTACPYTTIQKELSKKMNDQVT
jgi:hypothetical protein